MENQVCEENNIIELINKLLIRLDIIETKIDNLSNKRKFNDAFGASESETDGESITSNNCISETDDNIDYNDYNDSVEILTQPENYVYYYSDDEYDV